jgi:hypothetical protein
VTGRDAAGRIIVRANKVPSTACPEGSAEAIVVKTRVSNTSTCNALQFHSTTAIITAQHVTRQDNKRESRVLISAVDELSLPVCLISLATAASPAFVSRLSFALVTVLTSYTRKK